MVVLDNLPFTSRELSSKSRISSRSTDATIIALRVPPYCLSEKYFVNVLPLRVMQSLQPLKSVVSYVNRVRFLRDFIFLFWVWGDYLSELGG